MKIKTLFFLVPILISFSVHADLSPASPQPTDNPTNSAAPTSPSPSPGTLSQASLQALMATMLPDGSLPAAIKERAQDHRRWERITIETNRFGLKARTNSWVELQSGMHYRSPETGEWIESSPEIIITNNGAIGQGAPHQARFSVNISSPVGVEVRKPDNQQLKLRILGMAFYDFIKRTNVLIAELQDSDGQLVGANQVIYTNAFTDFQADVRYTYTQSGIEQDIILRQRPPLPEEYGLNPDSTRLLLLTEFIDPPTNVVKVQQIRRGWKKATVDKALILGAMTVGQGTAFALGEESDRDSGIPVDKHWEILEGRTFLIEEISFRRMIPFLRNLQASLEPATGTTARLASKTTSPNRAGLKSLLAGSKVSLPRVSESKHGITPPTNTVRGVLSHNLLLPPIQMATVPSKSSIRLASVQPKASGVVLDFNLVNATNMVLQGDTTYVVASNSTINLTGTNGGASVIEGGCVVKFERGARINFHGPIQCMTGPYRPAVFTSVDDNSVGTAIGNGTPTGRYADCALSLGAGGDLKYVNVRYAKKAIYSAADYSVSHSQFLFCDVALYSDGASFANHNVLMYQVATNYYGTLFNGYVEHLTSDHASVLACDPDFNYEDWCHGAPSSSLDLINCLTASITNGYGMASVGNVWSSSRDFPTSEGLFQTVGAGSHYLCDGSTNRDAGTLYLSDTLLADLKKKTTFPPSVLSNLTVTANAILAPQAQRDTDIPDLGWHYDPIDFALTNVTVSAARLTLTNGVAITPLGDGGITLASGATLVSKGSPLNCNHVAGYSTVQEEPMRWGPAQFYSPFAGGSGEWLDLRFTDVSFLSGSQGPPLLATLPAALTLRDCQLSGVAIYFTPDSDYPTTPSLTFKNCLFEYCSVYALESYGDANTVGELIYWQNNLFRGGLIYADHGVWIVTGEQWYVLNNVFDNVTLLDDSTLHDETVLNNAFLNSGGFASSGSGNLALTNLTFLTGPLGNYYQPTNSPLVNTGSTTANVLGLYHYTVTTNLVAGLQIKETNSVVDIGLHYVAVDSTGHPLDADGDGLPDYFENTAGNGVYTAGDLSDWQHADTDGDRIPDGWAFKYFGHPTGQASDHSRAQDDYDGDGTSNLDEYLNGTDPNKISFLTHFANDHLNTTNATGTIEVIGGVPSQMAILINDTNFASAVWLAYSSNLTVNLGPTDGRYEVWLGLRGRAPDSTQTWDMTPLVLDRVAPLIVITSPTASATSRPILQLQGYSPEPLAGVRFDLTNAAGLLTNLPGFVIGQHYDTNLHGLTTNSFQCFDIELTNGPNIITLRATDWAGNTSSNSYTGDTNPPVLSLYWPQDGEQISGTDFTLRGFIDDPTALVAAQIVSTNGETNVVAGLVERNGLVWVQGLPLTGGTNTLTLTMTDAAGNTATTNITVIQSAVTLTIDDLPEDQLNQPAMTISGTMDASGYTVWVNGMQATDNGDGTWSVPNAPLNDGGTAVIQARAIPNSDNSGNGTGAGASSDSVPGNPTSPNAVNAQQEKDKQAFIYVETYEESWSQHLSGCSLIPRDQCKDQEITMNWQFGQGGTRNMKCDLTPWQAYTNDLIPSVNHMETLFTWPADTNWPPLLAGTVVSSNDFAGVTSSGATPPPGLPGEHCDVADPKKPPGCTAWTNLYVRHAQTVLTLKTGGKGLSTRQNLFTLTGSATEILDKRWRPELGWTPDTKPIPFEQVTIGALANLGSDGRLYVVLPDNATPVVTPKTSRKFYTFDVGPTKHKLIISANSYPLDENKVTDANFIVGQQINFSPEWVQSYPYSGEPPSISSKTDEWTLDGTFVNQSTQSCSTCSVDWTRNSALLRSNTITAWWVSGGVAPVTYSARVTESLTFSNGTFLVLSRPGLFSMRRPLPTFNPHKVGTVLVDDNNYYVIDIPRQEYPRIGTFLHFGISSNSASDGIVFPYTDAPTTNSVPYGIYKLAQIIDSETLQFNIYTNGSCEAGYETNIFRMRDAGSGWSSAEDHSPETWADSPGVTLASPKHWLHREDHFSTWLMFRPNPPDSSIDVPMYKVQWNWFGSATNGPPWGKVSGDASCGTAQPTEVFPSWTNTIPTSWSPGTSDMHRTACFNEN